MMDVFTGSRPGRPTVLLTVSAVVLAGTLGLAWLQVRKSRALGPEQQVPGTPLFVRPPLGWVVDQDDPGSFVRPVRQSIRGQERWVADRRIRFSIERLPAFQPPLAQLTAMLPSQEFTPEPAKIGPFAAVQIRRVIWRTWMHQRIGIEWIQRVAILPTGHVINVEYIPMKDLTRADLEFLDRVCDTVRLDDPTLSATPEQALQRAGVEFRLENDWQVGLPQLPEVPGFYVAGADQGFPAWSIGVFRTWLANGRSAQDLLHDFAASTWLLPGEQVKVRRWQRDDVVAVASVQHPDPEHNRQSVASVYVVTKAASETLMLFVYTDRQYLTAAREVADRIASQVDIRPSAAVPAVGPAEQAGTELAALLTREGAMPWWGQQPVRLIYKGKTLLGNGVTEDKRAARDRNPRRGYQGQALRRIEKKYAERVDWELDGRALSYTMDVQVHASDGLSIMVHEQRQPEADTIDRVITINDVKRPARRFRPGRMFVCPPIESIAEAWVARETEQPHLLEMVTLLGPGTHTRLLRPLPSADHYDRVLSQKDYWPFGQILAFDEDGELQYNLDATARYERVSPDRTP